MTLSPEKQFEYNLNCIVKDFYTFHLRRVPFHFQGLRRAWRQCWHDFFNLK